ncbi:MAG TPA: energy transducer TonB [Caulobacteraceae bacterium]|jgi:protein TonB
MRGWAAAALLAVAGLGSAGLATAGSAQAPPPPRVVAPARPLWLERPTADQLARAYPKQAARTGIQGHVVLDCILSAEGRPVDCVVAAETPLGQGFGEAALKLARIMRAQPWTVDGTPAAAPHIPISFGFRPPA